MTEQLRIDYNAILSKAAVAFGCDLSDLTRVEENVLRNLRRGKESAIAMPVLAEAVGVSTRELQSVIQHLINDHGVLIASSCGKPSGYYYPQCIEDYRAGARQLKNRIIQLARRLRKMDQETYEQLFGQGNLLNP